MEKSERSSKRFDPGTERVLADPACPQARKRRTNRVMAVLLLLALCVGGCSKVTTVSVTVYSGNGVKIRLVEKVEKDGGEPVFKGYEHPWVVSIDELDALLGSILYQQTVMFFHGKKRHAFPAEPRMEMLKPIQEAFAKATPNQAVDFSFTNRRKWLIVTRDTLTDGLLFRKDGKLNCAFRNLAFEDMADPEGSGEPFRGDPTEEPVRTSWVLFVEPGQDLMKKKSSGLFGPRKFPNWIQLDLARTWVKPADEKTRAAGAEEAVTESLAGDEPTTQAEIQKRLEFLEELHKDGAISDASYQKIRQDLLDLQKTTAPPAGPAR